MTLADFWELSYPVAGFQVKNVVAIDCPPTYESVLEAERSPKLSHQSRFLSNSGGAASNHCFCSFHDVEFGGEGTGNVVDQLESYSCAVFRNERVEIGQNGSETIYRDEAFKNIVNGHRNGVDS